MFSEEVEPTTAVGNLPSGRLGAFLAKFKRPRFGRLSPRATDARKTFRLVLTQQNARAAKGNALLRQAAPQRLHRPPAAGGMRVFG